MIIAKTILKAKLAQKPKHVPVVKKATIQNPESIAFLSLLKLFLCIFGT